METLLWVPRCGVKEQKEPGEGIHGEEMEHPLPSLSSLVDMDGVGIELTLPWAGLGG